MCVALVEGKRKEYLKLFEDLGGEYCPCRYCEAPTPTAGTKQCDWCWEFASRTGRFEKWKETPGGRQKMQEMLDELQKALAT